MPHPSPAFSRAIGSTPLVRLTNIGSRQDVELWVKLEGANPGGSAKDRSAWALLQRALADGTVRPGGTIIESSSGNLGMALARLCATLGITFICVADQNASSTAMSVIRAVGGQVRMVDGPDPVTGDLLTARKDLVAQLLTDLPDAVNLDQYSNPAPLQAHAQGTMREITEQLGRVDQVLVATSTTGTIGGCQQWLREHSPATHLVAVDPVGSVLFGGERATRVLNGYGAGSLPPLAQNVAPDEVARIAEIDAVVGARLLGRREGILTGASGGAVISALLARAGDAPSGSVLVGILHDFGWAYLHTIYDDAWLRDKLNVSAEQVEAVLTRMVTE